LGELDAATPLEQAIIHKARLKHKQYLLKANDIIADLKEMIAELKALRGGG
jgi:hypothetical protein